MRRSRGSCPRLGLGRRGLVDLSPWPCMMLLGGRVGCRLTMGLTYLDGLE